MEATRAEYSIEKLDSLTFTICDENLTLERIRAITGPMGITMEQAFSLAIEHAQSGRCEKILAVTDTTKLLERLIMLTRQANNEIGQEEKNDEDDDDEEDNGDDDDDNDFMCKMFTTLMRQAINEIGQEEENDEYDEDDDDYDNDFTCKVHMKKCPDFEVLLEFLMILATFLCAFYRMIDVFGV